MNLSMNKASVFMAASWTGLAGLLLYGAAQATPALAGFDIFGTLLLIASSIALLWTRKADEYTEGLWNAGASTAFASMVILAMGFSFGAGFVAGITDSDGENPVSADAVLTLQIAAFYVALFIKRLLGVG
ncbi:MAG: hypothetical protein EDM03_00455 [Porphyrobacter sp. IPPAS B-1204]|nr:MAG: hypothetical protein EDM03_00455 [Porphyrobacter sp. IPPAS B-1204]